MSRLSRNILSNLLGQGVVLLLGFVAVGRVYDGLGRDAVGIIYFVLAMNAVLAAVLDLGISSTVVREVAARYESDPGYVRDLMRASAVFYWGGFLAAGAGVLLAAPLVVARWLRVDALDSATAVAAVRILGLGTLLALPRSLYASFFRGVQRMEYNNFIDAAATALQQSGVIVLLGLGADLIGVAAWISASIALGVAAHMLAALRFLPAAALAPRYSSPIVARNVRYAGTMMFVSLLAMVHTQADKLILSKLLAVGQFGFYAFGFAAVSRVTLVTSAIAHAAFPSFSELSGGPERGRMMSRYRALQDLVCFGTVPLFAAVPFATLPVFGYVFTPAAARDLLLPVTLVAVGFYMNGALNVPHVFTLALGRPDIAARANLIALGVVLPATGLLVYGWGLTGAGLSWVLYHVFLYLYAVPRMCRECLGIGPMEWFRRLARCVVPALACYGPAWIASGAFGGRNAGSSALAYGLATVVFGAAAYFLIGPDLRTGVRGLFRSDVGPTLGAAEQS